MSTVYLTPQWVETYAKDHAEDLMFTPFLPAFVAMLPQHSAALTLCRTTSADNVRALAIQQWTESDSPEAKQHASMLAVAAEAQAKVNAILAEAEAIADKAIPAFIASAQAYAQEHGAMAKQHEASLRASVTKLIESIPGKRAVAFPSVEPPSKAQSNGAGAGTRGRKAGSLDWHLASVTDNGEAIAFTGDHPTLSIVATKLGVTRDSLDTMLRAEFNGNDQSPEAGKSIGPVTITTASGKHELVFTGRETAKRGRKAGSTQAKEAPAAPAIETAPESNDAQAVDATPEAATPEAPAAE